MPDEFFEAKDLFQPDRVFEVQCAIRESSTHSPVQFLTKLLKGQTPTQSNVTELMRTWGFPQVQEACTAWLKNHNLPVPAPPPRAGIFEEFLADGLINADDYKEIIERGKA